MNFNFVEIDISYIDIGYIKLDISLDIYFSSVSLVDFLDLEISVWGLVAPPKLFSIFFIFCRNDFITKMNKMRGCPEEKYHFYF